MNKPKWYSIRSSASAPRTAEVFIYGDIGESWWGESKTAAEFAREISALDVDALTVRINSYGGSVSDGTAMYNALKRHKADVTVSIDGVACSIASLVAMAGDTVQMAENALLMIHAPWGAAMGDATVMREYADLLDTWAQAMSTSYASKTGRDQAEMLALLTDGKDHWFTASEALDEKFVDDVGAAIPVAARFDLSRFASAPAAAAVFSSTTKVSQMTDKTKTSAGGNQPEATAVDENEVRARVLAAEMQRRTDIAAAFDGFKAREGVHALMAACQNDVNCTLGAAKEQLLAHLAKGGEPLGTGFVDTVEDERDKMRGAMVSAIMARAASRDEKGVPVRAGTDNPFRGHRLLDMARACLVRAGVRVDGMSQMELVAAAFTQSTSDFPVLLENAMHKTLQQAYALQPDTWSRFCKTGSVSDFRAHPRYRLGSLGNLQVTNELGEFKQTAIPDGERASIAAGTKGLIISVSRQMIINDDLGAFVGLAATLGRSAKRTVEADVYALLAQNSGMGPAMPDGKALFHVDHGNIGANGDMSVAVIESMRVALASQKDVSGNDYLDLRPAILLCAMGLGGTARVVNGAEYDPDTPNKLQRPNMVRGLFRDIVDTPRLAGTRFYAFSDPNEAPVIEVAFLDGAQEPFLEQQDGFTVDGSRFKVRLDYGTAVIDYRGAVTAKGAA